MSHDYQDPKVFQKFVADRVKEYGLQVDITEEPSDLIVDGSRICLENLQRMVMLDTNYARETVYNYIEQIYFIGAAVGKMKKDFVVEHLMPNIKPNSFFASEADQGDSSKALKIPVVSQPNDTSTIFVVDFPRFTTGFTVKHMKDCALSIEEVQQIAQKNLDRQTEPSDVEVQKTRDGGRVAVFEKQDGYDAARLGLTGLFNLLAPQLGEAFYVAIPARDMFTAFSNSPEPFVKRMKETMEGRYANFPYQITPKLFRVTQEGITGADDAPAAPSAG